MSNYNRFAISALSRSNKKSAIPEELMVHKKTGQILIKTPTGDVISYDSIARLNSHINTVEAKAYLSNMKGDMYYLDITSIEFPEVINESTNILDSSVSIGVGLKRIFISVDLDSLVLSDQDTIVEAESKINVKGMFRKPSSGGGYITRPFTFNDKLSVFNSNIIYPEQFLNSTDNYQEFEFVLTDISFTRDTTRYTDPSALRHILHSIIVVKE